MNNIFVILLPWTILIFLGSVLPMFLSLEDTKYSVIRSIFYAICFLSSFFIFLENIVFKKENLSLFWYLVLFLILWISGHLTIARIIYGLDGAGSDLVGISYCVFALALGTRLKQISQHKYFSIVISGIWTLQCWLILYNVDPICLQAIYGKEDPLFSGAYQYIGDIFALTSILLIFQIFKIFNNSLQANKLKKEKYLKKKQLQKYSSLEKKIIRQVHSNTFILLALILFANIILFLNGSRASLISFLLSTLFIGHMLFFHFQHQTSWILFFVPSLFLVIVGFTSIYNPQFMSGISWDVLLTNRSFELVSSSESTSLEGRNSLHDSGFQDIMRSPIFGNYIERVTDRGPGTYMHNILSLVQDFGFPAFIVFLCLMAYCTIFFLRQWRWEYNYEKHVFNSLFVFSVTQLTFFRNFTNFYIIYIVFGIIAYQIKDLNTIFIKAKNAKSNQIFPKL
jgi:hypothetical protein